MVNILVGWVDVSPVFSGVVVAIIIKRRDIVKNMKGNILENMKGRTKNFVFNFIHCEHTGWLNC